MSERLDDPMSSKSRRIIHVPRRFVLHEWGGTEAVLSGLVAQQRAHGWEPEIHTSLALSSRTREPWNGITIHRYPYCYPFFGLNQTQRQKLDKKGGNLLSLPLFFSLLRQRSARLFHAHSLKRIGGAVFTAARWLRKPFVVTLHGGVFDVPEQELSDMAEAQHGALEWGKAFGLLFRSRKLLEEADAVICLGRSEFENARRTLRHDRIHRLGNGVDVARFAQGDGAAFRARHGLPDDALVIGCYSRFDPQKNQLTLVEAFDHLAASNPALHLVLAGPATAPDYLEALDRRIAGSPFANRIRRLDQIDSAGSELANAYHACDIFALPSRHEPFGIVVLEAWSAGKPVVGTAVGGLRDLIIDNETGLLATPGETASLASKLRLLVESSELRAQLGAAGRHLAQERYSWSHIAAETERIYQAAETHCQARCAPIDKWTRRIALKPL